MDCDKGQFYIASNKEEAFEVDLSIGHHVFAGSDRRSGEANLSTNKSLLA